MTGRRTLAMIFGAITTLVVFAGAMWLALFGGLVGTDHIILFVSIALGPIAAVAVIAGYLVWWLVLFLLTLVLPSSTNGSDVR
ncbi:MAG: hypothetical protein HY912_07195 [Desulfomonile tiedjei]|uniref:Uncharacterized protein n=1 Tax=Desulfomonile tiedjei TaxID=2358 RepID=A0A9D6UZQ4_9BACT|nr:hypothetical protein [Desulfomonile tiedjei]